MSLALCASVQGQTALDHLIVEPATFQRLGFPWEISGDDNQNACESIRYRETGAATWNDGLDIKRAGYDGRQFIAGSVLYLGEGTEYEVALTLTDSDGVNATAVETRTVSTRPRPTKPTGGTDWHVYPPDFTGARLTPNFADLHEALVDPCRVKELRLPDCPRPGAAPR